jgi:hypothetical protein
MSITLICGFGRCGTSLVMQMLEAGGMPVTGEWPGSEVVEMDPVEMDMDWLARQEGKAVKMVFPDAELPSLPPHLDYRLIWLRRNAEQQAKSQMKLMSQIFRTIDTGQWKVLADAMAKDEPVIIEKLMALGPVAQVSFERLLSRPDRMAQFIATSCGLTDAARMARVVRPRPPECAPDMAIEMRLIAERSVA